MNYIVIERQPSPVLSLEHIRNHADIHTSEHDALLRSIALNVTMEVLQGWDYALDLLAIEERMERSGPLAIRPFRSVEAVQDSAGQAVTDYNVTIGPDFVATVEVAGPVTVRYNVGVTSDVMDSDGNVTTPSNANREFVRAATDTIYGRFTEKGKQVYVQDFLGLASYTPS